MRLPVAVAALYWYRRLRWSYRRFKVGTFYTRRETWGQAKFAVRVKRLP